MSDPFLAEIKIFSFDFPPRGWAQCDGQVLPIDQNEALYTLLRTNFGGDGLTTFALPDLRGRLALHPDGATYQVGHLGGEETHALTESEIPTHAHVLEATAADATSATPAGNVLARSAQPHYRTAPDEMVAMRQGAVAASGGGLAHENMQPYLTVNFCISLWGVYPPRN